MEKENIILSRFEYDLLKVLYRDGYRYVARDSIGSDEGSCLWFYKRKPRKTVNFWSNNFQSTMFSESISLFFQFIKWEDKEPTKIEDLIKMFELQESKNKVIYDI